jgi:hypothetical protein
VSDGYNYSGSDYTQANSLQTKAHNIELGLVSQWAAGNRGGCQGYPGHE